MVFNTDLHIYYMHQNCSYIHITFEYLIEHELFRV